MVAWMFVAHADDLPPLGGGGGAGPQYNFLSAWSFEDTTTWTNNAGYAPTLFTNLVAGNGNGFAVNIDNGNASSAILQYNVIEADGKTNLTVDSGTIIFWFAPNWLSADRGGTGPGCTARLLELGINTPEGTNDSWFLSFDPGGTNIFFEGITNGEDAVYFSAPISWAFSLYHQIALVYSPTNAALYIDGNFATNCAGIICSPVPELMTNGFFIGSSCGGFLQARGTFDDLATYSGPLDEHAVYSDFVLHSLFYLSQMAPAIPSAGVITTPQPIPTLNAMVNPLSPLGPSSGDCITSSSVWITNMSCALTNQGAAFRFDIAGGQSGIPSDVFAAPLLSTNVSYSGWAWLGQGSSCYTYSLNLPKFSSFVLLGTMQDSDSDGMTDAYEKLVNHTDPNKPDTMGDGLSDLYKALHGISPTNMAGIPTLNSSNTRFCPVQ